jgi:hypothetical protein
MYQFGVPTDMSILSRIVSNYSVYWGFDSFQGLPEEKKGMYKNPLWKPGAFSLTQQLGYNSMKRLRRIMKINNLKLVNGFYNTTLTKALASNARPAFFVDINCDLYISTFQALDWMFGNNLIQKQSLIMYDDWENTPYNHGESRAHNDISRKYKVNFKLIYRNKRCRLVLYGVKNIGVMENNDVPEHLKEYRIHN